MGQTVDLVRQQVIDQLFSMQSFNESFKIWKPQIELLLGDKPSAEKVLSLAPKMREIFKSSGESGRKQGALSSGGAAWEAFVCYYLNLCLIGTNSVVIKKQSMIPRSVRNAMTVTYGTVKTNTESDLTCLTLPDNLLENTAKDTLESLVDDNFDLVKISIIQCKTNWNDNAQIPMLWDMIYNVDEFEDKNRISVGVENRYLNKSNFNYSFMTVPSNNPNILKPNSLAVKRVSALSGGNYWECETQSGIAQSLREIFGRANIGPNNGKGVLKSLSIVIKDLKSEYNYFRLLS